MSDRLNELRRQRALMQEHLAWLDAEIAAAEKSSGEATIFAPPAPVSPPAPPLRATPRVVSLTPVAAPKATPILPAPSAAVEPLAEKILEEYRVPEKSLREDVRRGCFVYFAAALVILAVIVVALYFGLHHG